MGPRPQTPRSIAARLWREGQIDDASAYLQAQALRDPLARRDWAALLFERGAYAAAAALWQADLDALSSTSQTSADPRWLLVARCHAATSDWRAVDQALSHASALSNNAHALMLRAQAAQVLRSNEAQALWDLAVEHALQGPDAALIHFRAAEWDATHGRLDLAETRYKKALKLDPATSAAHKRLGTLYKSQGRFADAKTRFERARRVDEKDEEARQDLSELLREQPALALKAERLDAADLVKRLGQAPPQIVAVSLGAKEPGMRVGLLTTAATFKFRAGGELVSVGGLPSPLTLSAGAYEVALDDHGWGLWTLNALGKRDTRVLGFASAITLTPLSASHSVALYDVSYGAGYFWAKAQEDRAFRGSFELRPQGAKGVTVVNLLGLEAWLMGVVPAEILPTWPAQALRAQAIAARTDGLRKLRRHAEDGFDVCTSVHCAMYRGVTGEDLRTTQAVLDSTGQVLELETGRLAPTFYMTTCGGHTADAAEVWSATSRGERASATLDAPSNSPARALFPLSPRTLFEWLEDPKAHADAYCASARGGSASYRWTLRFDAAELSGYVARRHAIGRLLAVEPLTRTPEGLVTQLRLVGSTGNAIERGDRIRSALRGIKSNLFYIETRRASDGSALEFLVHGGGWGHGVGFCQSGAAGMAQAGIGATQILRHYFSTARVKARW